MAETLKPLGRISLPRTLLRVLPGGAPVDTLDLQSSALQALGSSRDVLEQAKCVLSSSDTGILVSEIDGSFVDKNIQQPQEKRRGLNRKRTRFSMKPVVSMELENIHTKLDIEHLADPEKFFSEIEKIEIADKELKKLRGHDSSELLEQKKVDVERKRRPGIIKRISSYKHSFGTCTDNLEDHLSAKVKTVTSGQLEESFEPDSEDHDSNCFNALEEKEGEEPLTGKENKVGTLLENLLSSFESLDDSDDPVALVQEQLQLKKINLNTIQLPVTPVALTKTLNVKAGEQKTDRLQLALGSPVHVRSPLASISLLRRQSSKKDKVNDPYSSSPSPANASCFDRFSRVDDMIHESSVPMQEASVVEPSKFETHFPTNDESDVSLLGQRVDEAGQLDIDAVQPSHTTINFQHEEPASVPQGSEFCPEFCGLDVDEHSKGRDIGDNMSNNVLDQESRLEDSEILGDGSRSAAVTTTINGDAETTWSEQRENEELHNSSQVPLEKKSKGVGAHIKLKRTVEKRKSLAEAGTKFVSGLRRSTRNRIRPLEFWRGEKILYGRIHESLATVIGVKYSSPGHSAMKVKSYVSDDYADLLEKASLY